jgi:cytochrome P450
MRRMQLQELAELSGAQPLVGHMRELNQDRLGIIKRIGHEVDYMARLRGLTPAVVINHPDLIQELLVERSRVFDKSMLLRFALYPLAGEGLFTSRGDLWKRQRRLMAPLFQPSQVGRYAADMVACARRGMADWRDGGELELARETTRMTMSVAGKTLFDADTFTDADTIGRALTVALAFMSDNSPSPLAIGHLMLYRLLREVGERVPGVASIGALGARFERPLWVPGEEGRRLREAVGVLDEQVQRMIDARRARPDDGPPDLLARLLAVRDEEAGGERMSDKQVRDEVLTLFVAGHETTANGLAWTIYCLCRNPAIYEAVEREADALSGEPTGADLPRLALALRAFKEALRLYPPVYSDARQAFSATTLGGCACPKWTVAFFAPYALHRRPDLWPDPERFDPDRFLPAAEDARSRYAWLPFGAGPRICIGMHFAMMEAQLLLATMMRRARFELVGDEEPEPLATLRPRHGVRVRVRLRDQARRVARA